VGKIGVIFSSVLVFLSRIISALQHNQTLHHARFAALHELVSLFSSTWHGTGLLLGVSRFSHVLHVRPTTARRELGNLLIVAPTRGGKGLLATSQLLTWRHSVIVNDIKGDLYTQTALLHE
jgi:type IV secretory pathway TraG/TraD family ATPase VirD4